jgi:hypothetical protein
MAYLTGGRDGLPAAWRQHLEACPDCQAFAETLDRCLDLGPVSVPPRELDERILAAARAGLGRADCRRFVLAAWRRPSVWVAAAAAVAILIAASAVLLPHRPVAEPRPPEAVLAWEESGLDRAILLLAADLAFSSAGLGASGGGTGGATEAAEAGGNGLQKTLIDLETELFLQGLDVDAPRT